MKALIQRVRHAQVDIDGLTVGRIGEGLLVLLGVEKNDSEEEVAKLVKKILNLRIFNDDNERMNLSLCDIRGEILLVSQFTLLADTRKGNRPGFSNGASPEHGKALYEQTIKHLSEQYSAPQTGQFGADMQVSLCNNGPVTFMIEV